MPKPCSRPLLSGRRAWGGTLTLGDLQRPCSQWYGVTCDSASRRVTAISLPNCGLVGFPKQLTALARLSWLNLSWNQLAKEDIKVLGSLTGLKSLFLQLAPPLSDLVSLSRLTGLEHLDLSWSPQGSFPTFLKGLQYLEDLRLRRILDPRMPTGPGLKLPAWFGSLQTLINLDLSYNSMQGAVPAQLEDFSRLVRLSVRGNRFTKFAKEPLDFRRLTQLDVSRNRLNLTSIAFRPQVSSSLKELDLSGNSFQGIIPRGLSSLASLRSLSLGANQLTGTVPPFLWTMPTLISLDLSKNRLTGLGFSGHHSNLGKLKGLRLSRNKLQGPIPKEWNALTGLTALSLSYNNLTGTLPSWLSAARGLVALDVSSNSFTGNIPAGLGSLKGLMTLLLSNNKLTRSLPGSLFKPGRVLRVANNLLSGNLPPSALSLVAQRVRAAVKEESYSCGLLDVSGNYLTGPCYSSLLASLECPLERTDCDYWMGQELRGLAQNCLLECSKIPHGIPPTQRSNAQCARFCGADKRNGPCSGHGSCTLKGPKKIPSCTCSKGFVAPANQPGTCQTKSLP